MPGPTILWATIDTVFGLVAIIALRWRYSWPFRIALITGLVLLISSSAFMAAAWALASLAKGRLAKQIVPATVVFFFSALSGAILQPDHRDSRDAQPIPSGTESINPAYELLFVAVVLLLIIALIIAVGVYSGLHEALLTSLRERAETAELERDLRVRQAQAVERQRIAREMHDVLAHRISLVSMHSGVLAMRDDLSRDEIRKIATIINESAKASLTELRGVLGELRSDNPELIRPQPTLDELPDLIAETEQLGGKINQKIELPQTPVPPIISRHAYRIVQEGLTNARKHAPGAIIDLVVTGAPGDGLTIKLTNKIGEPEQVPGAGVGLVGIRERVNMCGGKINYGALTDVFNLEVWLPW
ncbi:MAG: hypothetical protein CSA83_00810 [Actinomycetales bacterium]|nr:MAG: hypothetical protein CSA83_00810 [Actinomycetales bacterium]